ncbi:MAG: biotin--[acetyl-CoA-carboxylase] ligase [Clostridia bacterium]|nr:biotin--[acetyl-CoA-carboxylase] ligase [Clostridia bacterium]
MTDKQGQPAQELLTILENAKGQYVSGEQLSQQLGITRAAIWKRIAVLKKQGFQIEAVTNKGYRLNMLQLPYGKAAVQSHLKTSLFGHELHYYPEVDSTNTLLKRLASEGAPHGTVVIADCQTAGRGRLGRTWMSSPGLGVWMSLLLRPPLHPTEVQSLTLAAAVAVCRALETLTIKNVGIKWPNDILIGGKKVCGILTELSAEIERVSWVVLGIGINVNHTIDDFPAELRVTATSLGLEQKGESLDRSRLAAAILNAAEEVYEGFLQNGSAWMTEEWKKRSSTLGKRVRLLSPQGEENAVAIDVTPDGKLIVKKEDGTIKEVLSGEISLRESDP